MDQLLKRFKDLCPWATEYVEITFTHYPKDPKKTVQTFIHYLGNGKDTLFLDSQAYRTTDNPVKVEATPYDATLAVTKTTRTYKL